MVNDCSSLAFASGIGGRGRTYSSRRGPRADAADENVEVLADTEQAYEVEVVADVENAADDPERPDYARAADIPPERRIAIVTGGAMDTYGDKQLRDPEDRVIDDCNQEQRRDKAMDKTLADSFPASDPPAWQS